MTLLKSDNIAVMKIRVTSKDKMLANVKRSTAFGVDNIEIVNNTFYDIAKIMCTFILLSVISVMMSILTRRS